MTALLQRLSRPALLGLATALETGRLLLPTSGANLMAYVPTSLLKDISEELNRLHAEGFTLRHLAYMLHLVASERASAQQQRDRVELVWTGQEVMGTESRDTSVVVRELFGAARSSVLIASYALDGGRKAHELFQPLAERMEANAGLQVRMFLNIRRPYRNQAPESTLLREFAEGFRKSIWPGKRLPEVFYDPRSLEIGGGLKACLHAKCVVVDDEQVLVTSANFTQAAHERNLEAGVLFADSVAARAMRVQFEGLVGRKLLRRVPGL